MRRVLVTAVLCVSACTLRAESDSAREILQATGVKGGLVVHVGCGDGKLTAALRVNDSYLVHGLDTSGDRVRQAREHIGAKGLCGPVSVDTFDGSRLPYADNLVNLLVADELGGVTREEVLRVLAPLGVAYVGGKKTVKPWPRDIDEWSHHCHGPDGNPVAQDRVVGPPKRFQWIAGPKWMRAHDTDTNINALVSGGGRIFYMVDEAPISLPGDNPLPDKWSLVARDAFNGVLLWKVPVEEWGWRQWKDTWFKSRNDNFPVNLHRRVVAAGEKLYATLGYRAPVSELDAATGKVLRTYEGTQGAREILYHDGQLILTVPAGDGLKLAVIDPGTGKVVWQTPAKYAGTVLERTRLKVKLDAVLNAAADDDCVCLMDGEQLACLDRKTGKARWRVAVGGGKSPTLWAGTLILAGGTVLYCDPGMLTALSTKDGRKLWSQPVGSFQGLWFSWKDVFVIGDLVWTWSEEKGYGRNPKAAHAYDLRTGQRKRQVPVGNIFNVGHHHRCYRNKATLRHIIASRRGAEFVDLEGGEHTVHHWVRGICHLGMMPANGLLYAPPHPCKCYFNEKLTGFCALAPAAAAGAGPATAPDPLEKGPAYGAIPQSAVRPSASSGPDGDPQSEDWPTFRGNPQRSGSTPGALPSSLAQRWNVRLGGKLSAPVVAGGKLFAAAVDLHTVHALDAATGKRLWSHPAGGRVDSPPTYHKATVIFGSADGRVTCLRASDGVLAWRFRAAPRERLIGAFGQLESAWPVHGSVLVHEGVVYFAAGRSSYVDGGIHVYALDPATGKILHHSTLESPDVDLSDENWYAAYKEAWGPGCLPDVLQVSESLICMRNRTFDSQLRSDGADPARVQVLGGLLDDTCFQRAYWYYGPSITAATNQQQASPKITASHMKIGLGRLLVHDDRSFYGIRMFDSMKLLNAQNYFVPGKKGYLLFATEIGQEKYAWSCRVPIRATAMAVGAAALAIAGPPDVVDPADPLGAFEARKGGVLRMVSKSTGEKIAECKLDSPPVFQGMAAAGGQLFLSLKNGTVVCVGRPR